MASRAQDESHFSLLPLEIKRIIASFLNDRSRRFIRATCTEWFNIIDYDNFTIYFARSAVLPDIIQTFSRYSKPIGLRFDKNISLDSSFTALASLTNLTSLDIEQHDPRRSPSEQDLDHFTNLTALRRFNYFQEYVWKYAHHFPHLTQLYIGIPCNPRTKKFEDFGVMTKLRNHSELKSLRVIDNGSLLLWDEDILSRLSQVTELNFDSCAGKFPFNRLPNLVSLTVNGINFDDFSVHTKLNHLSICSRESSNVAVDQLTALTTLRYLQICTKLHNDQYKFLTALTNLETFHDNGSNFEYYNGQYLQFIQSSKLTSLIAPAIVNIEYLSHLTSLLDLVTYKVMPSNTIDSIIVLSNITSLTTEDMSTSKYFPNLKEFRSMKCEPKARFDDLRALEIQTQLEALYLPLDVEYSSHGLFTKLTRLVKLEVCWDPRSGNTGFAWLEQLTRLKELKLYDFRNIYALHYEKLWKALRMLTDLQELQLDVFNEDLIPILESLPKLKVLHINTPELANSSETRLSNLTNLQVLRWDAEDGMHMWEETERVKSELDLPYLYHIYFDNSY